MFKWGGGGGRGVMFPSGTIAGGRPKHAPFFLLFLAFPAKGRYDTVDLEKVLPVQEEEQTIQLLVLLMCRGSVLQPRLT